MGKLRYCRAHIKDYNLNSKVDGFNEAPEFGELVIRYSLTSENIRMDEIIEVGIPRILRKLSHGIIEFNESVLTDSKGKFCNQTIKEVYVSDGYAGKTLELKVDFKDCDVSKIVYLMNEFHLDFKHEGEQYICTGFNKSPESNFVLFYFSRR
ncbi:hypothetical protein HO621_05395 [Streptococcus suis]|uniref:Uncharacterized protein n=1 Tax=Streptococcus suis TaxID=1307 RepID=A0A0Z8CHQ9_STRSU|nr:hypothetical protein [Streptococcus suis]NQH92526.1 hypothetical protein [Streptococcus suis]NQI12244.1 hypothetical protein [Streptococcus suis]NQJ02866.1 hypothetical protein [Streptococcus suis]CYU25583.1 Uncharacterised protein [Streptococcus suis]CYU49947.1 Uncharacterised protein [Streptococcus suis]